MDTRENVRAAVYCRISRDREGLELGVERQRADCLGLVKSKGWDLVHDRDSDTFTDNDISGAKDFTERAALGRMIRAIHAGEVDAVVAYSQARLYRDAAKFLEFCDILKSSGVETVALVADTDVNPGGSLFVATVIAAKDAEERRRTSELISRRMLQKAEAGQWHGGPRPFGYGQPPVDDSPEAKRASIATYNEINEAEATLLKQAAEKILNEGSLRSIAKDWRARGIKSTRGGNITESMIARTLTKPRIAGLIEHKGEVLGEAQWPAILDAPTWESVKTILTNPARRTTRANKDYILRGVLKCGRCGRMLTPDRNRYLCSSNLGCGRLSLSQRLYENRILGFIVPMADEPELRNLIEAADAGDYSKAQELRVSISVDRKTLQQIEDDHYIEKALDRPAFLRLSKSIRAQIEQKEAKLQTFQSRSALGHLGGGVMANWNSWDADDQRAIILSMVDYIEVMPSESPGRTTRDMSRIRYKWKYERIGAIFAAMREKGESYRLFSVWPPSQ
ncbi:MAG: recombinase family protein [Acidimicrobiales bacterium]